MKLYDWKEGLPPGELPKLAAKHGVRLATIYEVARGWVPSVEVARKLAKVTGGAVSVAEILGLRPDEAPAAHNAAPPASTRRQRRKAA